jgi:hypothetical protein
LARASEPMRLCAFEPLSRAPKVFWGFRVGI